MGCVIRTISHASVCVRVCVCGLVLVRRVPFSHESIKPIDRNEQKNIKSKENIILFHLRDICSVGVGIGIGVSASVAGNHRVIRGDTRSRRCLIFVFLSATVTFFEGLGVTRVICAAYYYGKFRVNVCPN